MNNSDMIGSLNMQKTASAVGFWSAYWQYFIAVLILALIFGVIFYFYRRAQRRD